MLGCVAARRGTQRRHLGAKPRPQLADGFRCHRVAKRPRERLVPLGQVDACSRVTAKPRATSWDADPDLEGAATGKNDPNELRGGRQPPATDARAKRRSYESCPSSGASLEPATEDDTASSFVPSPAS